MDTYGLSLFSLIRMAASSDMASPDALAEWPSITVHAPCFNEERMLPFFLAHYLAFCKKVVIYDH